MKQEKQKFIDALYMLCIKYRRILSVEPAWNVDTALGLVFSEICRKETKEIDDGYASDNLDDFVYEEEFEKLLVELNVLHTKLSEMGITINEALSFISHEKKISEIIIDKSGILSFPEYGSRVSLTPLQTALYVTILKYEDGILPKEIFMHKAELIENLRLIYQARHKAFNMMRHQINVDRLVDVTSGSLNENVSRIKNMLTKCLVDDYIARNYYINSMRNHKMRIPIDRNLVRIEI